MAEKTTSRIVRWCPTCDRQTANGKGCGTSSHPTTYTVFVERRVGGKRKRRVSKGHATKRDAEAARAQLQGELIEGTHVEHSDDTLGAFLLGWLDRLVVGDEADEIKPSTFTSYEMNVRRHILPHLGEVKLQALSGPMLRDHYAKLRSGGYGNRELAPKSVVNVHLVLHAALEDAVFRKAVARNVSSEKGVPPRRKQRSSRDKAQKAWDAPTVAAFLAQLPADHRFRALYELAFATGARRGELLAARWSDFRQKGDHVIWSVDRALVRAGSQVVETTPKTATSRRDIPIDPATWAMLERHRAAQRERRMEAGSAWKGAKRADNDVAFDAGSGQQLDPDVVSQQFVAAVAAFEPNEDERITLHGARHSHLSILLASGVPITVVSARAGHSKVSVTLDEYGWALPSDVADAADVWAATIKRQRIA